VSYEIRILDASTGPELPIVEGGGVARAIVWPGMGAQLRSLHRIWLEPGAATVTLTHPSDAVYYVIEGLGTAHDQSAGTSHDVREGSMFHIDAGTSYAIAAAGDGAMEIIGGPAPADEAMYTHLTDGA
jgi:mannose-6-phosphate isomerase-like protein (cupin superfamily)